MSTDNTENIESTTVYGYDPDTFEYEYSAAAEVSSVGVMQNVTEIPVPDFDGNIEEAIFDTATQTWNITIGEALLDNLKSMARARIDFLYSKKIKAVTSTVAQNSDLYNLKYKESLQYQADGEPSDLTNYPFLEVGSLASGTPASEYAAIVISKHTEYVLTLVSLEKSRLTDNQLIDAISFVSGTAAETYTSKIAEIVNDPIAQRPALPTP